jgi:heme-degrading monooxygenase HmoA
MPHARVGIHKLNRETLDEAIRKAETDLSAFYSQQPGFISYEGIRVDDTTAISINIWETEEQANEALAHIAKWREEQSIAYDSDSIEDYAGAVVFSFRS